MKALIASVATIAVLSSGGYMYYSSTQIVSQKPPITWTWDSFTGIEGSAVWDILQESTSLDNPTWIDITNVPSNQPVATIFIDRPMAIFRVKRTDQPVIP